MTVLSRSKNAASTWPSLGRADVVTVTVRHLTRTDVPLVGMLLPDVVLSDVVSMRRERRSGW